MPASSHLPLTLVTLICFAAAQVNGQEPSSAKTPIPALLPDARLTEISPAERKVRELVSRLVAGEFEAVTGDFDATMKSLLSADKLAGSWQQSTGKLGKFDRIGSIKAQRLKRGTVEYDVVTLSCDFESQSVDLRVSLDPDGQIAGLFISNPHPSFAGPTEMFQGKLKAGLVSLRLAFHLGRSKSGTPLASMDSPDQGQSGLPIESVEITDTTVRLKSKSLGLEFEGTLGADRQTLEGEFRQGGQKFPLSLTKVDGATPAKRPQTPQPPFPYESVDVQYENPAAGITLAGTLTVPRSRGPHPAVLLITGSGPQDRDETLFEHKPFRVLADYLTRRGIAVLRVDDRGIGGSTGRLATSNSEDFTGDVLAGVAWLQTRPEIDRRRIGLLGHSEGGLIAPLAASRSDDIAFIVLLAGTGFPGTEILFQQGRALLQAAGADEKTLERQRSLQGRMFELATRESEPDQARPELIAAISEVAREQIPDDPERETRVKQVAEAQAEQLLSPWFQYFLRYDPRPALAKVRCPVLALNGSKDLQVLSQENLQAIRETLTNSGHRDFEIVEFANLNHLFQTAQTGLVSEYGDIEETIAPVVLEKIASWIQQHCGLEAGSP